MIIPSDSKMALMGIDSADAGDVTDDAKQYYAAIPEGYRSGFGAEGAAAIKKFVENGGRLLAIDRACDFAIDACGLRVTNAAKGVPGSQYRTHGSTFNTIVDVSDPIAYGMPEKAVLLQWDAPILDIGEKLNAENYTTVVRYPKDRLLVSGALDGEKYMAGKAALVKVKLKAGEVVLYGFSPAFRAQVHGTFKLLFNALYGEG